MRSRVIPGSSPTMARRCPVMRLKRVDFPTLGRPTITTVGRVADMHPHDSACILGPFPAIPNSLPNQLLFKWVRKFLISGAIASSIPAALWLSIAVYTMFYDSLGTYHTPTPGHVLNNLLLGLAPFAVPGILLFLEEWHRRRSTHI